jgi:protein TonB
MRTDDDSYERKQGLLIALLLFIPLVLLTFPESRRAAPPDEGDELPVLDPVLHTYVPPIRRPQEIRHERRTVPWIVVPPPTPHDPEPLAEDRDTPLEAPASELRVGSTLHRGPRNGPPRRGPPRRGPKQVREGVAGLESPQLIHGPQPEYPIAARRRYCEGVVVIEAIIDTVGDVRSARVRHSPEPDCGLSEAALRAVRQRRYRPGVLEGKTVEVISTIRIRFSSR